MERAVEQVQLLQNLRPQAQLIAAQALDVIDTNYSYNGNAYNDPAAELYMPYHNGTHTRNVMRDALWLSDIFGLNDEEKETAVLAASAHDISHELDATNGESEALSADWLEWLMLKRDDTFSKRQRKNARLAILGTFAQIEVGPYAVIVQQATQQDYPSKQAEIIAHIVAAADLGRFCRPDGPTISHHYHQELVTGASGKQPTIDERLLNYQKHQTEIVAGRSYTYPTPLLEKALATHRPEVYAYDVSLVTDLQAGNIESWDTLLQRDQEFMQKNS